MEHEEHTGQIVSADPLIRIYNLPQGESLHIKLNELRLANELCDTWITTGGQDYPAHKCVLAARSQYFKARFSSGFSDASLSKCQLPQIPGYIVDTLLDFMYTGQVIVSMENMEHLLSAADYLLISELRDFCVSLLKIGLSMKIESNKETNLLLMYRLANAYGTASMASTALKLIRKNISWLIQEKDFWKVSYDYFSFLVNDDSFTSVREQDKFELIMRWISQDQSEREQYFPLLFRLINPDLVPVSYLVKVILQEKLILKHLDEKTLQDLVEKTKIKPALHSDVIIVGGYPQYSGKSNLMGYLVQEDEWLDLQFQELSQFEAFQHVCLEDKLYILGEKPNETTGWSHFLEYDLIAKATKKLADPPVDILEGVIELLCHGEYVFVLEASNFLYQYDTKTNMWKICRRLSMNYDNKDCSFCSLISCGRNIFAHRLSDFTFFRYHIDSDIWETIVSPISSASSLHPPHIRHDLEIIQYPYVANGDRLIIQDPVGLWGIQYDIQHDLWTEIWEVKDEDEKVPRHIFWSGSAHFVDNQVFLMACSWDFLKGLDDGQLVLPVRFHPDKGTFKLLKPSPTGFRYYIDDYQMSSHMKISAAAESLLALYPTLH